MNETDGSPLIKILKRTVITHCIIKSTKEPAKFSFISIQRRKSHSTRSYALLISIFIVKVSLPPLLFPFSHPMKYLRSNKNIIYD